MMGHATWIACLGEAQCCPFTKQPLRRDQLTIQTHSNLSRFHEQIVKLG